MGIWDVDALGEVMSSDLLMEWRAYRQAKADIERQELKRTEPSKEVR